MKTAGPRGTVRPLAAISPKTQPCRGECPGTLNIGHVLFQPLQTQDVLAPFRLIAQSEKRPSRWNYQGFTRDAVNQGIAAIPSPAGTHPITEHRFCKFPASRRGGRQQFGMAFTKCKKSKSIRSHPAAGAGRPSPSPIGIVDGENMAL